MLQGKRGRGGQPLAQSTGAAVPGRRAQRRLLRAARLSPCRLHVPVSGFGPLVLTKLLSRSMAIL